MTGAQNVGSTSEAEARSEAAPTDNDAFDLQGLRRATIHELRAIWRRTFRRHPGPGLTRALLIGMIAFQRQAERHGHLAARHEAFLDRVAARIVQARAGPGGDEPVDGAQGQGRPHRKPRPLVPPLPTNSLQIGTVLVRECNGRSEAVTVVEGGFLWGGTVYPTLSAVANAITGRHWNGWVFFGLKRPASRRRADSASSPAVAMPETPAPARQVSRGAASPLVATPPSARRRGRPPKVHPVGMEANP